MCQTSAMDISPKDFYRQSEDDYKWLCNTYRYSDDVDADFPPCPSSPEVVRSDGFTYDGDDLEVTGGYSRAPLKELQLLFRKNPAQKRLQMATKPWLKAQLRWNGISFARSASTDELWDALESAVKRRLCPDVESGSVAAIRHKLTAKWNRNLVDHKQQLVDHKVAVHEWSKRYFHKLGNPSDQARYDLSMFFQQWVDEDGNSAPHKTPEPVIIWDDHDVHDLRKHVDAIPGLLARITPQISVIAWAARLEEGVDIAFEEINHPRIKCHRPTLESVLDIDRFLGKYFLDCVGGKPAPHKTTEPLQLDYWADAQKLAQAIVNITGLFVRQVQRPHPRSLNEPWCDFQTDTCVIIGWSAQVKIQIEQWNPTIARLKADHANAQRRHEQKHFFEKFMPHINYYRANRSRAHESSTINGLAGSYIIHCQQIREQYGYEIGSCKLDIHAPTSTHGAVAAFNFGLAEGTMLIARSKEALERLLEEQPAYSDDELEEEEYASIDDRSGSSKRKAAGQSQQSRFRPFKRRLGGDEESPAGRFYFYWAGLEPGTSYLVLDEVSDRVGHFDMDKSGMSARGQFNFVAYGPKPFMFTLLKISDKPEKKPDDWSSYCEKERWIHW
ncbi:hypothetical protein F5Y18DRAFT_392379 [Xylariaceae sp. FL1019]|nr:hypothetical protein F5Y18DRAFT_392379 [Xylariaceae sp. FL1019]